MKPYSQLTNHGRYRRLRQLALVALQDYALPVQRLRFLAEHTSVYFRLDTPDGQRYAVRVYSNDSSPAENAAEMFWLAALQRDTTLHTLQPVRRRDGGMITHKTMAGVPGEQRLAVYEWVPGKHLAEAWTPQNYFKLGRVMAQLHDHAAGLVLPENIRPKRWDRVFYFPDERVVYNSPAFAHLFTPQMVGVMDTAVAYLNPFLANFYTGGNPPMLMHGDLHVWNVHLYRGDLYVIDFEDMILGYPAQDVAITLFYGRSRDNYPALRAAFQDGYNSLRPWPLQSEQQLQTLIAARTVNFINYVAWVDEEPQAYIHDRCAELKLFLEQMGLL